MNQDTEVSYAPVTVEIRSSSSVKGAAPGVLVRATSKATDEDRKNAVDHALKAWRVVTEAISPNGDAELTAQLRASVEKEASK